jgi:hypothetical protein
MKVHIDGYEFGETFVVDDLKTTYWRDKNVFEQRLHCHNEVFGKQSYWVRFKESYKIHLNPFKKILAQLGLLKVDISDATGYYTLHGTIYEFAKLDIEVKIGVKW